MRGLNSAIFLAIDVHSKLLACLLAAAVAQAGSPACPAGPAVEMRRIVAQEGHKFQ